MQDFSQLSERIRFAMNKSGLTQTKIARECGIKPPSVAGWLSGRTKTLNSEIAPKLSKIFNVNLEWLISGKGMPEQEDITLLAEDMLPSDDYVQIKEYQIACGAGPGRTPTFEETTESIPATYRRSWFTSHGYKPEYCKRFVVQGDSMNPVLYSGDKVTVNLEDTFPIHNNHVYAIVIGDEVRVKRLLAKMNGDLIIRSDNKDYPDEIIQKDDDSIHFHIIGRVVDKSGDGGL